MLSSLIAGFLIGLLAAIGRHVSPQPNLFLEVGFLGGLSTFSAFSLETVKCLETSQIFKAGANAGLNLGLCL
ncbi:MAG: CrcB family protein [Deltaproteobacteria bacterium]|nr:CrcB family protein [Deltaproteobacteria bacterium]